MAVEQVPLKKYGAEGKLIYDQCRFLSLKFLHCALGIVVGL